MDKDGVVNNNDEITQYTYAYGTKNSKTVSVTTVTRIVGSNSKVLSVSESTLDGMESWSTVNGLVTHSVTTRPAAGQLNTTVEYPDGSKTITYTVNGLTTKVESYQLDGTTAGNVVEYTYDEFDRVAKVTEKFGTTVINEVENTSYNNNGQPLTVTTNGKATTYVYDNMGRRTSVTLPGSRTVTYTYKNTGELATVDGAETYKQSYDYDSQGRMSTLSTYKTPTVPQNTTWAYNNRGFMTSKTYADGKGTTYTYSDDGELATRVWDRGITTTYSYDNAGRQTGIDYSDTTPDITYTYDWMGNPATVTDAEGTRDFSYNYTTSGHPGLASVTVPGIVASIDYTYDAYGRRTAMSLMKNSSAVLTNNYGYDTTSGKLNKIDDGTYSANYTYADGTGLITQNQIKLESTSAVVTTHNRTYDTRLNNYHLLNTSNTTGATTRTYSYLYNDKDQRTKLTLPDGSYWEYSYDDKGQVTGGVKKNAAGNLIAGQYFGYSYDGIGNRLYAETKLAALKLTYTTNNVNQYTQINNPGIVPVLGEADADTTVQAVRTDASNLTGGKQKTIPARSGKYFSGAFTGIDNSSAAQTIPYDVYAIKDETTTQQIQKASSSYTVPKAVTSPTYDTDGNMLTDGTGWNYTWNGENRMIQAESADKKLEFAYDFMGRRVSKKVYTGSTGNWTLSTHQKFVYNGYKQIAEYDASDNLQKTYTWQPVGLDVPLWVKDGTNYYYYIVDGNKNVRSMVDTSGNEVTQYDYNPFGKIVMSSGAYKDTNKYRFSSEYHEDETGLVYYNFRYYHADLGRWTKLDPIQELGGVNVYGMVFNNTISRFDVLGLGFIDWCLTGNWNASKTERRNSEKGFVEYFASSRINKKIYTGNWNASKQEMNASLNDMSKSFLGRKIITKFGQNGGKAGFGVGRALTKIQILDPKTGNISISLKASLSATTLGVRDKNVNIGVLGGLNLNLGFDWMNNGRYGLFAGGEVYGWGVDVWTNCLCIDGKNVKYYLQFRFMSANAEAKVKFDNLTKRFSVSGEAMAKILELRAGNMQQLIHGSNVAVQGELYGNVVGMGFGGGFSGGPNLPFPIWADKLKVATPGVGGGYKLQLIRAEEMDCE